MKDDKIIQIAATALEVYGLTESGKLARLDNNIGQFVEKCSSVVLCADKVNILKGPPQSVPTCQSRDFTLGEEKELSFVEKLTFSIMGALVPLLAVAFVGYMIHLLYVSSR